jgi:hypothetical protein
MEEARDGSIKVILDLLKENSINDLKKKFGLYACPHPQHDITILNYGKVRNWAHSSEVDACRGLVVESNPPHTVISRGFDRFVPQAKKSSSGQQPLNISRATLKEDGSLIFMFKYNEMWMLSTMHNFADGPLAFAPTRVGHDSIMTYTDLFKQIIGQPLQEFAETLVMQINKTNNVEVKTFCFEMCSIFNRVIRLYDTPTLFLIAAFGGDLISTEISISDSLITLPQNVHHIPTISFPPSMSMDEVKSKIEELSENDCTFEGLVLQLDNNDRIKVKNPYYSLQHTFKYRGFTRATPETLVPLIFDNMDGVVIENVLSCVGDEDPSREAELTGRRDFCLTVIKNEKAAIHRALELWDEKSQQGDFTTIGTKEYIHQMESGEFAHTFSKWKVLFIQLHKDPRLSIDKLFKIYFMKNIDHLFPQRDIGLSASHGNKSCPILSHTVLPYDTITEHNDGLGNAESDTQPYKCFCGQTMRVERLKWDVTRYRTCHCGERYGFLCYPSGSSLLVCSDASCACNHEVNKFTNQPLGIPASEACKNYRLHVHELIDSSSLTKTECYKKIADITGRSTDLAHMALMGTSDCVRIIKEFCSPNT